MQTKAAYLMGTQDIRIGDCDVAPCGKDDVVVQMKHVGICGSDMHFYEFGRIGRRVVTEPFILGHECAGIISEVGENVTHLKPGDKVVMEPGVPCGKCEFCRSGRYNLCPDVKFISSPPDQGAMRQLMTYPAAWTYRLPDNITTLEGAMIEPFAVGLHAASRGEAGPGKTAAILGTGTIGLMTLLACRADGIDKVYVSDIFENRLDKAKLLGADETICAAKEDTTERIAQLTDGRGVDIVFETAGSPKTAVQAVTLVKRGGVIVQVGNITAETPYVFNELSRLEVDIRTVFRYHHMFQKAIGLMENGTVDLMKIGPRIFPFEKTAEAFACNLAEKKDITKVVVEF